jgi:hypothetical protein
MTRGTDDTARWKCEACFVAVEYEAYRKSVRPVQMITKKAINQHLRLTSMKHVAPLT